MMSERERKLGEQVVELWRQRNELRDQLAVARAMLREGRTTRCEDFTAGLITGRAIAALEQLCAVSSRCAGEFASITLGRRWRS